jgi:hypothetical protein
MMVNLLDLAVKKQLAILEDISGGYILGRLKANAPPIGAQLSSIEDLTPEITPDERLVLDKLFAVGDTIRLEPAYHALVGGAVEALHHQLRSNLEKVYFLANSRYLIPGLLISLATVVRSGFSIQGGQRLLVLFLTLWLLPWSLGCMTVAALSIAAWRYALSDPYHAPTSRRRAIIMSAICVAFFLGEAAGLGVMGWAASIEVVVVLILLSAINCLFHSLVKAPARAGRSLMGQIEGLRTFLTSTEKDRRDLRTPLRATPDMLERLLPYAMALNVETAWGERLAAALAQTAKGATPGYSPSWYSGPGWNALTASTFATSLGSSFLSALSSSTTARSSRPGSRRASGGRNDA